MTISKHGTRYEQWRLPPQFTSEEPDSEPRNRTGAAAQSAPRPHRAPAGGRHPTRQAQQHQATPKQRSS